MRVIEQLVQHFWSRGAISRDEALYLVKHGFVREADLPGLIGQEREIDPATYQPPPVENDDDYRVSPNPEDERAKLAEQLEDELTGRNAGSKKSGRKKKPTGHNLAPAAGRLAGHFAAREPFSALVELASRVKPCRTWRDAAAVIADADAAKLEPVLVALLNARPRALGELWFWFDVEPLFAWTDDTENGGPVADGLKKLMRAANPNEVGRLGQLMKAAEVRDLAVLLDARRNFLALLPLLYHRHFARLSHWLVPPTGDAITAWLSLPWALILVYTAWHLRDATPPAGYDLSWYDVPEDLRRVAFTTALGIDHAKVFDLLAHHARERVEKLGTMRSDYLRVQVFRCPLNWRV